MQIFNVQGMSCGHCVKAITQALQTKDAGAEVKIDLGAKTVEVESKLSSEAVIEAIQEEGYEVRPLETF
ncbi:heavy-metal-associated domain-containing protein [Pseudomonas sp. SWRI92]|uniref:Cation transporter n=1 Tax=Pseudomonas marvdashtae TaxID=2745500 RepID=A0A923FTF4_9PSED|nr:MULTISPECIES: cation transporter [Pseudomonas]MBC3377441.1 heavy-metal-associated domain-containing protein [Pseudomonas sp. SWRI92]MBV4550120.1 cation transporter [Pseudomonas marvdashtae]